MQMQRQQRQRQKEILHGGGGTIRAKQDMQMKVRSIPMASF
jgi:hypothetical protein